MPLRCDRSHICDGMAGKDISEVNIDSCPEEGNRDFSGQPATTQAIPKNEDPSGTFFYENKKNVYKLTNPIAVLKIAPSI